jgi:hypothetical protein
MFLEVLDQGIEVRLKLPQALSPPEGLVHAEAGEDQVGLVLRQLVVKTLESPRSRHPRELVGGPAQIANPQAMLGESAVEEGLEVTEEVQAFGEGVADEDHMVPLLDVKSGSRGEGGAKEERSSDDEVSGSRAWHSHAS